MATVRHAHSSSLYSEGVNSLADQVERATEADDPNATVLTFTEVGSPERSAALKNADPDHWAAWIPDQSDVAIMWRKANYSPVWKKPIKLTDKEWTDGKGRKHQTWCASALLKHTEGHKLFVSVCHLPSNVQNGSKFNDNKQSAAWKDAVNNGWHKHWNDVKKKDKPALGILTGDWNIDFHSGHWRGYVQDIFDSMHLGWKGHMPPDGKGTHGHRLIDASWSSKKANKCVLLKDDGSSDHRPFGEAIPL